MTVKVDPGGFPQRKLTEVPAVSAAQMREVQRTAQEDYGLDILQIMENGGRAVATLALAMLGGRGRGQRVVVLAGGGNTGAAGLCAVRHLSNWGFNVAPVFGEVESEASLMTRRQIHLLRGVGLAGPGGEEVSEFTVEEDLAAADLVIDAILGYGHEGPPLGMRAAVTELAVASGRPILAVDVPTGVNATTGEVYTPAIVACTSLLLDLPKRGALAPQSRPNVGELYLADLGIPISVHERMGIRMSGVFSEGPIVRLRR
jgi:NAD(P)H-hydrate epimerase